MTRFCALTTHWAFVIEWMSWDLSYPAFGSTFNDFYLHLPALVSVSIVLQYFSYFFGTGDEHAPVKFFVIKHHVREKC